MIYIHFKEILTNQLSDNQENYLTPNEVFNNIKTNRNICTCQLNLGKISQIKRASGSADAAINACNEPNPLCCPKCGGEMKIISFINEYQIIRKILEHLSLWVQKPSRDPPDLDFPPERNELNYEPFYDDLSGYEEPCIMAN